MAKRRTPPRDVWDRDDFEDITSHSTGEPPQRTRPIKEPSRPPGPRPKPRPHPQQRKAPPPSGRPKKRTPPPPPPPRERKRKPPMKKGTRRLLTFFTILVMLAVTCVLAVSLLFKITEVTVTGDMVYQTQDILNLCNYNIGDNLFFVSTADRVEKLKSQLPYIEDVEIKRHIPGTLEIHITGTQVACCIYTDGTWLYVSGEGKILEMQPEPREGVMRIDGIVPQKPKVGGQVHLEDAGVEDAYSVILKKIVEMGAWGEFTRLDMSDPYNITLWYQDRVECKLGSGTELDYKVQFGYKLLREGHIGLDETGVLDLSYADVRRAGFTLQPVDPTGSGSSGPESSPESDPESEEGRGDDIPDEPLS